MKFQITKIIFIAIFYITTTSCIDSNTPELINEEELITTVEYTLINEDDGTNVVVYKSVDPDADGPEAPTLSTTGVLKANSTYLGSLRFLNESDIPVENITEEVMEESVDHEIFYSTPVNGLNINKIDQDAAGNLLGLQTTVKTGAVATGNLIITLIHLPLKPNDGTVSSATSDGGEPDAEVTFFINIQ